MKQNGQHGTIWILIGLKISLFNDENSKKLVKQQMQYDFDKKTDSTKVVQDKRDAVTKLEIANQKIIRNFSLAGAVAVIIFSIYGLSS